MEYEAELEHFGVLGMRWGKRKTIPSEPSKDPPKTYRTHLPTQEQLLSESRTPAKINPSTQKNDQSPDDLKKDVNRMVKHSAALMAAGVVVSHGPQMKDAYRTIKNSARMLRGQRAAVRQGKSLLHHIGRLPLKSLTPVKASARMIGRSLQNPR